jgi:molybdenum cofactor guanylyltransferase
MAVPRSTIKHVILAAGVVLVGGRSTRMGEPKAGLEWHGSTLGYRTASVLARALAGPIVVVRAPGQELPALPSGTEVVEDAVAGRGPLQGLAAGLGAVADRADVAFVCSTDLPFLRPAFIQRVLRELPGFDVALPVAHGFRQPLAAAYRTSLVGVIADLLAAGQLRLGMLFDHCAVNRLDEERLLADPELAAADPRLESLVNVNTRADYEAARSRDGVG